MIACSRRVLRLLVVTTLIALVPLDTEAKGYSSGGGKSYSSSSSSHSSSSSRSSSSSSSRSSGSSSSGRSSSYGSGSSGRSSSSGSSSSHSSGSSSSGSGSPSSSRSSSPASSGGSKSFTSSGSGKSYSSGNNERSSYSSGKSYSSGSEHTFSPRSTREESRSTSDSPRKSSSSTFSSKSSPADASPSSMTFDTSASRAAKEAASKRDFTAYKQSQVAKSGSGVSPTDATQSRTLDPSGNAPPIIPRSTTPTVDSGSTSYGGNGYSGPYRRTTYYPDPQTYSTRSVRIRNYYTPYYSRPVVIYNDNYSSLFWWWLLDRPLEERARWTYYHRHDMDEARYRALVYQDMELDNRVRELEERQAPVEPDYVPDGMDRDLMYTDKYINHVYHNRPTHNGQIAFWFIIIPTAIGVGGFCVWLVFFKRWQTRTT